MTTKPVLDDQKKKHRINTHEDWEATITPRKREAKTTTTTYDIRLLLVAKPFATLRQSAIQGGLATAITKQTYTHICMAHIYLFS